MKRSIFFKIFGGYVLVATILSSLILAYSFTKIREFYIDAATKELRNIGVALEASVTPLMVQKNYASLDSLAKKLGKEIRTRITVMAPDGTILADSEADPKTMENHRTRTEMAQALEGNMGRFLRVSDTLKEEMLYIAVPIRTGDSIIGVLRLSFFLKEMNQIMNHFQAKIFQITLIILGFALVAAFLFSRSLSKPIRELSNASKRVAGHDFNVRVFLKNKNELSELAESFNSMVSQIRTLFAELNHQKKELTSIISSLQEGLVVLDRDDRIVLCNQSFRKISAADSMEGRFYWEMFREPQFDALIRKVRDTKQNCIEEIEFNERVYLCSATYLEVEREIAAVFHDITEIRNLEKVKTDFVLNVSHELRTPLTAIKGFTETLEETAKDDESRHYVHIIRRNTDRLINIINDLLSISELESKDIPVQFVDVNLREVTENAMKMFDQRVRKKGLHMSLTTSGELPSIKADPFRLEQMLINLLDNSVKYSESGGITIDLKATQQGVVVTVTDTGIGIPKDHLSRIFERFYVVDKSRSKRMGGTGLGLSIVKHIVIVHKGTITVESVVGKGTTFTITLPQKPTLTEN